MRPFFIKCRPNWTNCAHDDTAYLTSTNLFSCLMSLPPSSYLSIVILIVGEISLTPILGMHHINSMKGQLMLTWWSVLSTPVPPIIISGISQLCLGWASHIQWWQIPFYSCISIQIKARWWSSLICQSSGWFGMIFFLVNCTLLFIIIGRFFLLVYVSFLVPIHACISSYLSSLHSTELPGIHQLRVPDHMRLLELTLIVDTVTNQIRLSSCVF